MKFKTVDVSKPSSTKAVGNRTQQTHSYYTDNELHIQPLLTIILKNTGNTNTNFNKCCNTNSNEIIDCNSTMSTSTSFMLVLIFSEFRTVDVSKTFLDKSCRQQNSTNTFLNWQWVAHTASVQVFYHWTICPSIWLGTTGIEPISPEQNCMCNSSQQLIQLIINMVGCIYFAPGLWLLSQPKISRTWQVPNYTVSWQRHTGVHSLPKPSAQWWLQPATCESSRLRAQCAAAITVYNNQSENSQCLKGTSYHPKMRAKAAKVIKNVRRHSIHNQLCMLWRRYRTINETGHCCLVPAKPRRFLHI